MGKLSALLNIPAKFPVLPESQSPMPELPIGLEFEYEQVAPNFVRVQTEMRTHPLGEVWEIKEDGSLRNGGMEFVFKDPLKAKNVPSTIDYLCQIAQKYKFDPHERAGIHVHTEMVQFDTEQLEKVAILYALLEPYLFQFVGDSRRTSTRFCRAWMDAPGHLDTILDFLVADGRHARAYIQQIPRYSALNFASLTKFGTIEWRHLPASLDSRYICEWLNIILRFIDFATTTQIKSEELILYFLKNQEHIVNHVLGYIPKVPSKLLARARNTSFRLRRSPEKLQFEKLLEKQMVAKDSYFATTFLPAFAAKPAPRRS